MSRNFYILMCLINVLASALLTAFTPTPVSGIPNAMIALTYLPRIHRTCYMDPQGTQCNKPPIPTTRPTGSAPTPPPGRYSHY